MDLQSIAKHHLRGTHGRVLATSIVLLARPGLNRQPAAYKTDALTIELQAIKTKKPVVYSDRFFLFTRDVVTQKYTIVADTFGYRDNCRHCAA